MQLALPTVTTVPDYYGLTQLARKKRAAFDRVFSPLAPGEIVERYELMSRFLDAFDGDLSETNARIFFPDWASDFNAQLLEEGAPFRLLAHELDRRNGHHPISYIKRARGEIIQSRRQAWRVVRRTR